MRFAWLPVVLAACAADPSPDLCEQAARHRQECVGDYVTPPVCDAAAEESAEALLELSCEQIAQLEALGKADGAFCDWFGVGCKPDEEIFRGPSCDADADCAAGWCAEGHCFAGVASDEMAGVLDEHVGRPEVGGSATHLLVDNSETRALRDALIDGAEESIHLSALLIEDDDLGWDAAFRLAAAAERGVEVRVLVDATTQYLFGGKYEQLAVMRDAGVHIIPYNPVDEWKWVRWQVDVELTANMRLHEKLLIVDGRDAVLGGRNVGDHYLLDGHWRDVCAHVTGLAVGEIQRMFLEIWDELAAIEALAGCPQADEYGFFCPASGASLADEPRFYPALPATGGDRVRPVYSNPRSDETPLGYLVTLDLVRAARSSIWIQQSYFVPPRRLRKHLKAAARRGVEVVVITNSKQSTDAFYMYYASLNYYEELIEAGVEIRHWRGDQNMHAKTMLVDGEVGVVGSYNLDPRSAVSNSESLAIYRDAAVVDELAASFTTDLANTDIASHEDISAADWAKAKLFRLVEPLL